MPVKIFFCYAHEDEALLNKLKTHLRPLQRQGLIDVWHDGDISAGTEWEQEIRKHLNEAQIILLLVSPDFISSDYAYGIEMERAIERHERGEARVIPIILRPVYWQKAPFGKLQALPKDAKPVTSPSWHDQDEAFFSVTEGIRKAVEELTSRPNQLILPTAGAFQPTNTHPSPNQSAQPPVPAPPSRQSASQPLPPPSGASPIPRDISRRYVVVALVGLGLAMIGGTTYLVFFYHAPPGGSLMDNWTLHGNAGTNPPNDFLGTTDSKPLVLKTDGTEAMRIHADGKVGIGTTNPGFKLQVTAQDQLGLAVQGPNSGVGAGLQLQSIGASDRGWGLLATGEMSSQGAGKFNIRDLGSNKDDLTITNSGKVGIGPTDPHARLDVEGDLFVNGNISKTGAGEFVRQRNPVDPTQNIVYATPIGNEVGTYTRGTGKLVKGEAVIELPEHFSLVTSEDGLTVQLTPRGEWLQLYVVQSNTKQIIVQEAQGKSGQFDYLIQGIRKGYEHHQVIQEKIVGHE